MLRFCNLYQMKYVRIIKLGKVRYPNSLGVIFEVVSLDSTTTFTLSALRKIHTDTGNVYINVGENLIYHRKYFQDVTPVYKKMLKLMNELSMYRTPSLNTNFIKTNYNIVSKLLDNFLEGVYPTKEEFKGMNIMWRAIKSMAKNAK